MSFTNSGDFVLIPKGSVGLKYTTDPVTVSLTADYGNREREQVHYRIALRIKAAVLDELAWKIGDYVAVHEGKGPSAGKVLLVPTNDVTIGFKLSSTNGGKPGTETGHAYTAFNARVLSLHAIPNESQRAQRVKYRAFNAELLVDMPSWFKPLPPAEPTTAELPRKRPYARAQVAKHNKKKGRRS